MQPDEASVKKEIQNYRKLDKINQSDEFNQFFQLQIDTVVQKILQCFTGEGPKDWDAFCKLRGEITAYLYPIQQIRGAKVMGDQLQKKFDEMFNKQPY